MAKPEIRFKGFEEEWGKFELYQIFQERHVISTITPDLPQLSFTIEEGVIKPENRKSNKRDFLIKDKTNKKYLVTLLNDIIYNPANVIHGAIHKNSLCNGVVSPIYKVFYTNQNADFLDCIVRRNSFIKEVSKFMEGTVIKLRTLKPESFLKMSIHIGATSEQKAIADFYISLDSMIQATTKKIASLRQMKSASLISMFPQTGESTPRVRFRGYEGEWMKESAGHLFITFNERNRPDLPVLSANQDIRGMAPRKDIGYQISHDSSNEVTYKVVRPGQFVIHLRSFQGGFAHSSVEGITSPAYTVFGFKKSKEHDDYFWKIIFMSNEFIKSLETITYGIRDGKSISFAEFSEMKFLFPSKKEQQCIAAYFHCLDKQISLQEQKLEKLKQIKAACLDKMFV
jgi:type I restriction enzyme S subunit